MKIILTQDLSNLGEEGDIKVVANGYARNYLIPRKMAVPYNKASLNMFEQKKQAIEKKKEAKRKDAMGIRERLSSEELNIAMPAGEKGKLFGAVTSATIVEELGKLGITVEKKKVEIPGNSIKMVGNTAVTVRLYGGETASLKVNVTALKPEDASEEKASRKDAPEVSGEEKGEEPASEVQENEGAEEDAPVSDTV